MSTIATHSHWPIGPAILAGAVLSAICVNPGSPQAQPDTPQATHSAPAAPRHLHWHQIGRASWYGRLFQGHETASGEDFDMNAMTCAHRSLPMGSLIKVTNLRNNKSVIVRVNDRGPVPRNRVIDLSYAAAHFLGFGSRGTTQVRLELITGDPQLAQMAFPANGN